eukprot:CAMPEP_0168500476 /NCGR_PEP_ID=MMETSP0228-20121227/74308_1 /TAXON_ID=133427 /ORGANISM="Protoceratium reticulatum, Strain CCCM 535 (=CCMP 1889)" /LENGTH=73 /DNA_ID=CAMNT_0008517399 /DNA_START=63 /DNA_END=281 /DNA_ORIENTATION=-
MEREPPPGLRWRGGPGSGAHAAEAGALPPAPFRDTDEAAALQNQAHELLLSNLALQDQLCGAAPPPALGCWPA